jgi:tetratricopeptide (TPR) repeat protein
MLLQVSDKDDRRDSITRQRTNDVESSSETESETSSRADDEFDKDITMLEGFAFVSATIEMSTFEMHRLVQLATRRWLDSQGQAEHWKKVFVCNLDDAFPSGAYENWAVCQKLLPHAIAAMNLKMKDRDALLHKASICYRGGWYVREQGLFNRSEEMSECSRKIRQEMLGPEHPSTLTSMGNLAATFRKQGRWDEAEQLEVRVMETRTRALGAEHPSTLTSMGNLASTYSDQGRWGEAEQLEVRVMETRKTVLGAEHPDTLTSMANLASTYWKQGRWGEAEQLELRVMETSKTALGAEHPDTLTSMANLAETYTDQKRWTEAEELLLPAVHAHQRVLGLSHPSTEHVMLQLHNLRQAKLQQTSSYVTRQDDDSSNQTTRNVAGFL